MIQLVKKEDNFERFLLKLNTTAKRQASKSIVEKKNGIIYSQRSRKVQIENKTNNNTKKRESLMISLN